jgi:DNA invertase Pin-like site-specific DNA recombinase
MNVSRTAKLIGYARVSTTGQELQLQLDALKSAGIAKGDLYTDKASGSKAARPGLDRCLQALKPGDTLLVWRLDRLGRSLRHLIDLVDALRQRGVGFKSICDGAIDTTTASGELIFNVFASLAQFERRLIQERTRARVGGGAGTRAERGSPSDPGGRPSGPDGQDPSLRQEHAGRGNLPHP